MKLIQRYVILILLFLLIITWYKLRVTEEDNCPLDIAKERIERLCHEFNNGMVNGTACKDLCHSENLKILGCYLNSAENTSVVFAEIHDADKVVIKTKKVSSKTSDMLDIPWDGTHSLQDIQLIFHEEVKAHRNSRLGEAQSREPSLTKLLRYLWDVDERWLLDKNSMKSLWTILQQDEYFILKYFHLQHFPRVYGFCGPYYVTTKSSFILERLDYNALMWSTRVRIALQILDFVKELQDKSLVHCDVHPGNFGLTSEGELIAIDADGVYPEKQLSELALRLPGSCTKHEDCHVLQCSSECNLATGKCSPKYRIANSLHFVCKNIFGDEPGYFGRRGLLSNPQGENIKQLESDLQECSKTEMLPWAKEKTQELFDRLFSGLNATVELLNQSPLPLHPNTNMPDLAAG